MMKLDKLTAKQEALIAKVRDEWVSRALLEGDELDEVEARKGLEWLYALAGKKKPITVLLDSPLALQYASNILSGKTGDQVWGQVWDQVWGQVSDQVRGQVSGQVWGQVWDQVWDQVSDQVWDQVSGQVWDQVRDQVRDQVWDQVSGQVWDQVWGQVWDQVSGQVRGQVRGEKLSTYYFAYEDLAGGSGWVSFFDFFERQGIVKHKAFKRYVKLLKSGIFMTIFFENIALACRRPLATRRDELNRLHHDQLPAIEWRDGYKMYFLHGTFFDDELFQTITSSKLNLKDILKIDNADQRVEAWRLLSPDKFLKSAKAKHLHTGVKGTKLYAVPNFMETEETEYCMVMEDPSSDRVFLEWVEPAVGEQGDADFCQASAFGVPLEDYLAMTAEA